MIEIQVMAKNGKKKESTTQQPLTIEVVKKETKVKNPVMLIVMIGKVVVMRNVEVFVVPEAVHERTG